mmetsp:Transcript_22379/g.76667  ORF Transcript_22379/g.76667 Transcript_22379/m.76667 type:complete len:333 (-) Transcript_22379:6125-7123(-)
MVAASKSACRSTSSWVGVGIVAVTYAVEQASWKDGSEVKRCNATTSAMVGPEPSAASRNAKSFAFDRALASAQSGRVFKNSTGVGAWGSSCAVVTAEPSSTQRPQHMRWARPVVAITRPLAGALPNQISAEVGSMSLTPALSSLLGPPWPIHSMNLPTSIFPSLSTGASATKRSTSSSVMVPFTSSRPRKMPATSDRPTRLPSCFFSGSFFATAPFFLLDEACDLDLLLLSPSSSLTSFRSSAHAPRRRWRPSRSALLRLAPAEQSRTTASSQPDQWAHINAEGFCGPRDPMLALACSSTEATAGLPVKHARSKRLKPRMSTALTSAPSWSA